MNLKLLKLTKYLLTLKKIFNSVLPFKFLINQVFIMNHIYLFNHYLSSFATFLAQTKEVSGKQQSDRRKKVHGAEAGVPRNQ